jgi:hypothetical protein
VVKKTSEGLMEFNLKAEDRKTTETTEAFGNIKFEGGQQQMALLDLNGYFNITGAESGKPNNFSTKIRQRSNLY